jgi:hypothetical protein
LKLDNAGGITWEETFGGAGNDAANSVQQTQDGGYVVAGYTDSSGAGLKDVWALRLDSSGILIGDVTYGGTEDDEAHAIKQTTDNGFIIAGLRGSAGTTAMYLVKTAFDGTITWERTYGDINNDEAYSVQQTTDGGYIVAGYTHPADATGDLDDDIYVLKLNDQGEI